MKKMINLSIGFAILGMALGFFYRELTKWTGFYDTVGARTQLGFTHVHTLVLGMIMMIIFGLVLKAFNKDANDIKTCLITYISGLLLAIVMMTVRGTIQVVATNPLSSGMDSMISGISGLSHIVLAVGLIMILLKFRKFSDTKE